MQRYASGDETARQVYDKFIPDGGAVNDGNYKGTAFYSADQHFKPSIQSWVNEGVYMDFTRDTTNKLGAGSTWFHEHGHCIDARAGDVSLSDAFYKAIKKDCKDYEKAVMQRLNLRINDARFEIGFELCGLGDKSASVQDIYGGSIGKRYPIVSWGHDASYWKAGGKDILCQEAFANMFEAEFDADKKALMKKYLPTAWAEFEKILGGI